MRSLMAYCIHRHFKVSPGHDLSSPPNESTKTNREIACTKGEPILPQMIFHQAVLQIELKCLPSYDIT